MYQETFKRFMKVMRPVMKAHGFTSRGNNFYKRHSQGNIGIINVQKNWRGLPKFSINIGVYSLTLAEFFLEKLHQTNIKTIPSIPDSHWQTCLGSLVPREHPVRQKDEFWKNVGDKWWDYEDITDIEELFNEIKPLIIEFGIPAMDKHLSDEQLIEEWIVSEKITKEHAELEVGELRAATERARVQILRDLSILLLAYGEKEKFKKMMFEFHEYLQRHPEYTGLKEDYDKIIKEQTAVGLKYISEKRDISEEESTSDYNPKKIKT